MTTTIVFAESSDGDVVSRDASYANALAGPGDTVDDTGTVAAVGQDLTGGQYEVWQACFDFDGGTVASDQLAVTSYVRLRNDQTNDTGVGRQIQTRKFDWGATIHVGDFQTPAELTALDADHSVVSAHNIGNGQYFRFGQKSVTPGQSYLLNSSRNRLENTPSSHEDNHIRTSEVSGTSSDPALYYTTVPESRLFGVLGAQVQLSDGTHVYLEASAEDGGADTIALKHHDGSSASTIDAVLPVYTGGGGSDGFPGGGIDAMQGYAVVVDASDNIYVIGRFDNSNSVGAVAYTKGVGYSWTEQTFRHASLPSYDGLPNNFAAAWHNEGTGGTIVAVISHEAARNDGTDIAYALLNCNYLLTGSGSLLRASGSAQGVLVEGGSSGSDFNNFNNETGTLLDVAAAPGTTNRGFVVSAWRIGELGNEQFLSFFRYQLASGSASFADVDSPIVGEGSTATKEANAKCRVIGISTSQFVTVSADEDSGAGLVVTHWQNIGTSSTFTILAQVELDDESISTMPSASSLATASNWDAVYDPQTNKVWVYYFDTADDRRLMRTGVDLNTGLADQSEVEVNAAVGASGSTNHAIRVHRGTLQGDQILVSVANETSGGTHSTIYVTDSLNVSPSAPTLTPEPSYDADDDATFEWTFNDPNAGDTQSAFQLQVNTSAGASAYDTGKTVSGTESHVVTGGTLTNPGDWRWRVRTWDSQDEVGPWSDFMEFSTSDAGTVTIIDPAMDNPAGVVTDDYLIEWTVAGTTQDDYRVRLYRTDTETLVSDTDWVNSSDTTFLVTGMLSDVEYRVEVTVRDAVDVETNTDTVLITPSYGTPDQPTADATEFPNGGYILVSVTNPTPTGDRPEVDHNDILRRVSGSEGVYTKIGEAPNNGSLRDYTATAGITYEYVARGQSE